MKRRARAEVSGTTTTTDETASPVSPVRPFQRDMSVPLQDWRFCVDRPDEGLRLDRFLAQRVRWRSRSELRRLIEAGRIEITDGSATRPIRASERTIRASARPIRASARTIRASTRLRAGQQITLWLDAAQCEDGAEPSVAFVPEIVFEDEHLLAVNKPPLVSLYPSPRHRSGSLIEQLHRSLRERDPSRKREAAPPSPCHRLDRETSGLLLFAKDRPTRSHLGQQFEARTVKKTYLALVQGTLTDERGEIDLPLDDDLRSRVEIKRAPDRSGQPAVTGWRIARRLEDRTLLALFPTTGRQHQLRVHLAAIGHPIVGDKLYGGGDDLFLRSLAGELSAQDKARLGLPRHALHSWRIAFEHPASSERRLLEAPLWPDIEALVAC